MVLSLLGWLSGLSSSGIVIFGCAFGFFGMYQAKKTNAKLLFYFSLCIIFFVFGWLGDFVDFVTILLTGRNMDNSHGLKGILGYMWAAPTVILFMYIGAELLIPEKKRYILAIFIVLGVLYEIFLFLDPLGSFEYTYPASPGDDIIDDNIAFNSPLGIMFVILLLSITFFWGFGSIIKGILSKGILRKKFILLGFSSFLLTICSILDTSLPPGIATVFVRIGILFCLWLMYFSLREEPEKKEKIKPKKEVRVEGDFFRISQYKKEDITEEEVSISKEKKICLVCKGKALGMTYICTECEAFYCVNCSQALSEMENVCWVCNTPIDKSKPVKPFKKVEEEIQVETSEKPQKKPKTDKKL